MDISEDIKEFEDILDRAEKDAEVELDIDPLKAELDDFEGDEDTETAFMVIQTLMTKFKDLCDHTEIAWKVQEIPAPLRQRLITLDQANQERYQKLYIMIQKYADQMKKSYIRKPSEE